MPFEFDGRRVVLIDTPGFDDTNKSDTDILRMIAHYLAAT
jgi:predicted GTPase